MTKRDVDLSRIWLDGVMGVVTGDARGCPVQFRTRGEIAKDPVTGMRGCGTFNLPAGTWTDDSSLTLALLDSIRENHFINLPDIMYRFALWLTKGSYTPFGESFDIGFATGESIYRYMAHPDVTTCGGRTERDNGNGSLMRILPACLYAFIRQTTDGMTDEKALRLIHEVGGLTHNHMRAKIGCGLYYFCVRSILEDDGDLTARLQKGIDDGFAFYKKDLDTLTELSHYGRLSNLYDFAALPADEIKSGGYVVDTLEAAVWSLLQTDSFADALLVAVNLGKDTDTVGAVCGGLAGLIYGYDDMPSDWLDEIQRREWVEGLCRDVM